MIRPKDPKFIILLSYKKSNTILNWNYYLFYKNVFHNYGLWRLLRVSSLEGVLLNLLENCNFSLQFAAVKSTSATQRRVRISFSYN